MKIDAFLIAGTTASGKSRAGLELATRIGGTVINADSMQVYREARILTARPSDVDMRKAPHLLYGHVPVREAYSAGRFANDAARALSEVRSAGRVPIFVGGTGLYFKALVDGLSDMPAVPRAVREKTRELLETIGNTAFHAALAERDPEIAAQLRPSDRQRMARAFEVFEASGRPLSHWQKRAGQPLLGEMRLAKVVLEIPRTVLRARIETRLRAMLAAGALAEAMALEDIDSSLPAAKIIGRRELAALGRGLLSEKDAFARALAATNQYAKRQDTWFRNQLADWHRVDATDDRNLITKLLSFG